MADQSEDDEQRKKARLWLEEAKDRQTTHWDMDFLSADEIDRMHRAGRRQQWMRRIQVALLGVGVVTIAGAVTWLVLYFVAW